MDLRTRTAELLGAFDPGEDSESEQSQRHILQLLRHSPAPFSRANYDPGHITASALVFSPDRSQILLVWHERLGRWLQPGGHVEAADASVVATAAREAQEETAVELDGGAPPELAGLSIHPIPAARGEPLHRHYDLVFRFLASDHRVRAQAEVSKVIWCSIDTLGEYGVEEALTRSVARAASMVTPTTSRTTE